MQTKKEKLKLKKEWYLKKLGKKIFELRQKSEKGILLFSYEYDLPSSTLSKVEKGQRDVQISTLARIAESFGLKTSELLNLVEEELPEGWSFIEK